MQSLLQAPEPSEKHSCTLRIADRPAFICLRAQVNGGVAKPNWAQRERKITIDEKRAPDLQWHLQGVQPPPPPPAVQPQAQAMETSDPPVQRNAAPEVTTPLRAAIVAIHGPPPKFAPDLDYATTVSSLPKCSRRSNMDRTSTLSCSRTLCSMQLVEP